MGILIGLLTVAASRGVSARWANVPTADLVTSSDLIVIGTLHDVYEWSQKGMDYGRGAIVIDEVVCGRARQGERLTLTWQNRSNIGCPRVEHRGSQGVQRLWLLGRGHESTVRADYPGRVLDPAAKGEILGILATRPLAIIPTRHQLFAGRPAEVTLIYRNATPETVTIPDFNAANQRLLRTPQAQLTLRPDTGNPRSPKLATKPGRVNLLPDGQMRAVAPGQEYAASIDLNDLFGPLATSGYLIKFAFAGTKYSTTEALYIREPPPPPPRPYAAQAFARMVGVCLSLTLLLLMVRAGRGRNKRSRVTAAM